MQREKQGPSLQMLNYYNYRWPTLSQTLNDTIEINLLRIIIMGFDTFKKTSATTYRMKPWFKNYINQILEKQSQL